MLRNLFEPYYIVLAKLILNIYILSLIFHHFFSGIYLGNVMSFSTLGKYCQFWDNETTSIFNWKCTTPLFKSWYKSQVIREVILCIGSNLIYLRMGFREFCHRLQVFCLTYHSSSFRGQHLSRSKDGKIRYISQHIYNCH